MTTRFGKYLLLHNLAVGGVVEVYLAKQTGMEGFEKLVLLKKLNEQQEQNRDVVEAFLNEARTAARLNHPNIVQVYDLGRVGNSFFIAMECVTGENLRGIVKQSARQARRLPVHKLANIVSEVLQGLHFAHTRPDAGGQTGGVVHRNICPENVVVTYEGTIKIVDFGIAKSAMAPLTFAGVVKGSLAYMAPEQCQGQPVDGRADVFAVGAILYELCTGRAPFKRETDFLTIKAVTEDPLTMPRQLAPELPEDLERIIVRALERDRERRYATAEQMQLELGAFLRKGQFEIGNVAIAGMMKELFADKLARARTDAEAGGSSYPFSSIDESLTVSIVTASASAQKALTPAPAAPARVTPAPRVAVVDFAAIVEQAYPAPPTGPTKPDPTTGVTKVEKPIDDGQVKTDVNRRVPREELSGTGTDTADSEPPEAHPARGEVTATGVDAMAGVADVSGALAGVAADRPAEDAATLTVVDPAALRTAAEPDDGEPRTSPEMVVVESLPDRKRSVPALRAVALPPASPAASAAPPARPPRPFLAPELPTVIIERTPPPLEGQRAGIPLRTLLLFGAVALVIVAGMGLLLGRLL
jgi:serine/threonine-protein kinase